MLIGWGGAGVGDSVQGLGYVTTPIGPMAGWRGRRRSRFYGHSRPQTSRRGPTPRALPPP